jgi:hypothetical protein
MPTDPLMQIAWAGALHHALGDEKIVAAFREATGNRWQPGRGIDAMIDKATGADRAFLVAFVDWFNANIWGDLNLVAASPPSTPEGTDNG